MKQVSALVLGAALTFGLLTPVVSANAQATNPTPPGSVVTSKQGGVVTGKDGAVVTGKDGSVAPTTAKPDDTKTPPKKTY